MVIKFITVSQVDVWVVLEGHKGWRDKGADRKREREKHFNVIDCYQWALYNSNWILKKRKVDFPEKKE